MKETISPHVWDDGQTGSAPPSARGILRLRQAADSQMMREIEFARGALKCPSLAPPYHVEPAINGSDLTSLLHLLHGK